MSTNKNNILNLYKKATNVDFIEYILIYPHRIHYASEISFIKDEEFICIIPNSENTIDLKAPDDIVNMKRLFTLLETKTSKFVFVRFDENMDNGSIFNVIREISRVLTMP